MKRTLLLSLVTIVGLGSWTALVEARNDRKAGEDIVEIAVEAGSFETLVTALGAANLVETLRGEGPFTVFAPSDDAFAALPAGTLDTLLLPQNRDKLAAILTYHVVSGRVDSTTALSAGEAATLEGGTVRIRLEDGRLRINDATVVANDIAASNGIIHVIDSVLLPPAPEKLDPALAVARVLEAAINRGAPLFNSGQVGACAAVYEIAVMAVIDLANELPEECRSGLTRALRQSREMTDASERAWVLRRAMDAAYDVCANLAEEGSRTSVPSAPSASNERVIFSFDDESERWFSVNDNVMGGISRGGYSWLPTGAALFSGALSLENNGGFSTIRSDASDLGLDGYDGFVLRVKGDGRTYSFGARASDNRSDVNTWRRSFDTVDGEWVEIKIPFAALKHTVMGRQVPGSGPLPGDRVRSLSFMIADKNESPFRLEIDWIKAYRDTLTN